MVSGRRLGQVLEQVLEPMLEQLLEPMSGERCNIGICCRFSIRNEFSRCRTTRIRLALEGKKSNLCKPSTSTGTHHCTMSHTCPKLHQPRWQTAGETRQQTRSHRCHRCVQTPRKRALDGTWRPQMMKWGSNQWPTVRAETMRIGRAHV